MKRMGNKENSSVSYKYNFTQTVTYLYKIYIANFEKKKLHYMNSKITQNEPLLHLGSMHKLQKSFIFYITMKTSPATFFIIILPEKYNVSVHTQVAYSYKFRYFTRTMQYGYGTESKEAVIGQPHT
jgi:hypothetical protein